MPPVSPPTWTADLSLRARRFFALKVVGVSVFTWLFFIGYFHLLRHPAYAVVMMPLTMLDHAIPFQPSFLFAYLSLWLYVGVAPGLQKTFFELIVYGLWVGGLCIAGLVLFYFWPTQVPSLAPIEASSYFGFALLQGVDATGNACPSMHVAVAAFTAIRVHDVMRQARAPWWLDLVNWLWFAAIAWSTLAIKQHVALDALAGALLGLAFALPSLRWRPRAPRAAVAGFRADIIPHR